jgi:hypothetical protein
MFAKFVKFKIVNDRHKCQVCFGTSLSENEVYYVGDMTVHYCNLWRTVDNTATSIMCIGCFLRVLIEAALNS